MKYLYFTFGFVFSLIAVTAINEVYAQVTLLEQEQLEYREKNGTFFSDVDNTDYQIFTYEKLCSGFYEVIQTKNSVEYIGYGDLSKEYTYSVPRTDVVSSVGSSSVGIRTESSQSLDL